jgi:hypothetical protein
MGTGCESGDESGSGSGSGDRYGVKATLEIGSIPRVFTKQTAEGGH